MCSSLCLFAVLFLFKFDFFFWRLSQFVFFALGCFLQQKPACIKCFHLTVAVLFFFYTYLLACPPSLHPSSVRVCLALASCEASFCSNVFIQLFQQMHKNLCLCCFSSHNILPSVFPILSALKSLHFFQKSSVCLVF